MSDQSTIDASVLPWQTADLQAPEHALLGETALDMFGRMFAERHAYVASFHKNYFRPARQAGYAYSDHGGFIIEFSI